MSVTILHAILEQIVDLLLQLVNTLGDKVLDLVEGVKFHARSSLGVVFKTLLDDAGEVG